MVLWMIFEEKRQSAIVINNDHREILSPSQELFYKVGLINLISKTKLAGHNANDGLMVVVVMMTQSITAGVSCIDVVETL